MKTQRHSELAFRPISDLLKGARISGHLLQQVAPGFPLKQQSRRYARATMSPTEHFQANTPFARSIVNIKSTPVSRS